MSKILKRLKKMRQNPRDCRIEDLEVIANHFEIKVRKSGGSHVIFDHPNWVELLSVPAKKPIKPVYIEKFILLIEKLENNNE